MTDQGPQTRVGGVDGLVPWTVRAVNLPEHEDNAVHTDEGARAAGFPAALVAGTTVYAYLAHVPTAGWGEEWLTGGWAEVRFRHPVFDDDPVQCIPRTAVEQADPGAKDAPLPASEIVVDATVDGDVRASARVGRHAPDVPEPTGEQLPAMTVDLGPGVGDYGERAGDRGGTCRDLGLVHPAAWPVIGNRVTMRDFVTGPWIHVRSHITHVGPAPFGAEATVRTTLADRFDSRAGERVVLDVRVAVGGACVAVIEHESIIRLHPS